MLDVRSQANYELDRKSAACSYRNLAAKFQQMHGLIRPFSLVGKQRKHIISSYLMHPHSTPLIQNSKAYMKL